MSKSPKVRKQSANLDRIWQVFNPDTLRKVCQMAETDFAGEFDMDTFEVPQVHPSDFYAFRDNGSKVLAVAHLDTVSGPNKRSCNFLNTAGGTVVYSRALDDRLGAYTILDMLPRLGLEFDILLTVGEETGQSTALYFDPPKEYDWVIEFDRGGTDVVMYQFEDDDTCDLVRESGAKVGDGTFSDICYLEHLGVKAFNWGIGYQDYHSARSHAFLDDTFMMVSHFMNFHEVNEGIRLGHIEGAKSTGYYGQDDEYYAWLAETARRPLGAPAGTLWSAL